MITHTAHHQSVASSPDLRRDSLDKRLALLFWPLLSILLGIVWLLPGERVPDGTLLVGTGVILLALNVVRLLNGIPVRVLASVLGALALAAGLAEYAGARLPLVSLTLIVVGASIAFELFHARRV
jgi:hypothetical protein